MDLPHRMRHGLTTRLLHLLLAVAIVCQLVDAQLMRVPRPGPVASGTEAAGFTVHEYVGLATMTIVASFWLWLLVRRLETDPGVLFPWFSRRQLAALRDDVASHLRAATGLTLPDPDRSPALAPAIQGLGLMIVLVMAATGTAGYLTWTPGTPMTGFAGLAFDIHGTLANALWAYVIVHVAATLLHELLGHRLLRRVLPLSDKSVVRPAVHEAE
jgi:cytochrome b561